MLTERRVDHNALRTNQAFTISLLALAFVLDWPALAAFVAAVMLISALVPPLGLFTRVYRHVLRPAGIIRPDVQIDNAEPHRFAQLLGVIMVTLGVILHLAAADALGWVLPGIVIVLASLNLFAGWCAGCMMYYWLNRLGVPGFNHSRIEATR
ncbi:MAG: DUF4395 domain-containing protein [Chloroflexi bacterium]|nr:MAG: DUF4395 domain-containing protein [Chloroflexota bacterium]